MIHSHTLSHTHIIKHILALDGWKDWFLLVGFACLEFRVNGVHLVIYLLHLMCPSHARSDTAQKKGGVSDLTVSQKQLKITHAVWSFVKNKNKQTIK